MTTYTCPVCGYDKLRYPPEDFTICPSCGTEFGYHDMPRTPQRLQELRSRWLATGPKWHSRVRSQPENWKPLEQVARVQHGFSFGEFRLPEQHPVVINNNVHIPLPAGTYVPSNIDVLYNITKVKLAA